MIKIHCQPGETVEQAARRTIHQIWAEIAPFSERDKTAVSHCPNLANLPNVLVSGDGWALVEGVERVEGVESDGLTHTFFVEMVDGFAFESPPMTGEQVQQEIDRHLADFGMTQREFFDAYESGKIRGQPARFIRKLMAETEWG